MIQEQIEYVGNVGVTAHCIDAVLRYFHFGDRVQRARLLSHDHRHAFLLELDGARLVYVRTGFTSGYSGEGPKGLSLVLALLDVFEVEVMEHSIAAKLLDHGNRAILDSADLERIRKSPVVNALHRFELMHAGGNSKGSLELLRRFPRSLPWGIFSPRLKDLVLKFPEQTQSVLLDGYKRLEAMIKAKMGEAESLATGVGLFKKAFDGKDSVLVWDVSEDEQLGRTQLLIGAFKAYRNVRAHEEMAMDWNKDLSEFLLLSHLFEMAEEAVKR